MNQKLLYIIITIATIGWCGDARAWGETTSYVLEHADEEELHTISTGESMALSGPGAKLTFEAKKSSWGAQGLYVEYSTNGGSSWSELSYINSSLSSSYKSFSYDISTDVTHIRFRTKTGSTLVKYYKNVKVTRATTLATSTTSIDFGTITNRNSSTLNASIDYNNTTYNQQVTGTCTDPNFTVTPTTVGATGNGQAIPVIFVPTTAGTHSGTVTLTMNGKTVTFSVTGVGQTTYYTKAVASATTGGSAYVSFTSFEAATNSSDTKNSGVTTATSASAVAYYRAVPNKRYAFVGWKANLSDASYVSNDAEFQTPAYTYDSESSGSPTIKTYYAVFEEKPNVITLEPTATGYDADIYETVTLHRTFKVGYNTIALPFATNVATLTGRTSGDDWVAQLSAVTYNQHDGYTMFFQKVSSGAIAAMQPYILYLGEEVVDPSWTNITLVEAQPVTITPQKGYSGYADWQMSSNFTVGMNMQGKYGIVNSAGGLKFGGAGSTLNAFTAYITAPAGVNNAPSLRVAYVDEDGTTTYIDSPFNDETIDSQQPVAIYGPDGQRRAKMQRGVNIVRYADGTTRKLYR